MKDTEWEPEPEQEQDLIPQQAFVSRHYRNRGKEVDSEKNASDTEILAVRKFVTQPARVGVTFGLTVNLGNYESARVEVTLNTPCYAEEVDAAFEQAKEWVETRIKQEVAAVKKSGASNIDF